MQPSTRRSARFLAASWAVSWAGVPLSGAFGSVVVLELTHDLSLTGVPFFIVGIGSAIAAYPSGHLMDRVGRLPVLVGGHLVAAFGFTIGTLAILLGNIWLFFAGHLVGAFGAGAVYLTRLAAADLYPASERARGLGRLVLFLALGAAASVPLTILAQELEAGFGASYLAVLWGIIPVLSVAAALLVAEVHPDPRKVALEIQAAEPRRVDRSANLADEAALAWRPLVAAGVTLLLAQASMATVMSVAGASLQHDGHSPNLISLTMTVHIVAMFAFSPWIGTLGDRWGRKPLLLLSGILLTTSTGLVALLPQGEALALSLFGVGLGWSFAFIGATAMIADVARVAHRGRITGFVDFGVAASAALSSLAAGWSLGAGGIQAVGALAFALTIGILIAAFLAPRRIRVGGTVQAIAADPSQ